jgi:peptide/nickel transport system permease protein
VARFIAQRLVLLVPVLLGILFITFVLARSIRGDPCQVMLGERATKAACDAFRVRFGLDKPIIPCLDRERVPRLEACLVNPLDTQFVLYLGNLAQGDLGRSIKLDRPVSVLIVERLPMTFELSIAAMIFASVFGLTLGVISAVRHNSITDVVTMIGANAGISMPVYWLGLMMIALFAVQMRGTALWMPPSGRLSPGVSVTPLAETFNLQWDGAAGWLLTFVSNMYVFNTLISGRWDLLRDALWHLTLPALAVGTIPLAIIARITRSSMLEVLGADYIRTARAKGLAERVVVLSHGLRNALLPIVTIIGLQIGGLLSGAVLTETTFGLPGIGKQLVDSILARDYPVVQAFVILAALIYVGINLIVDLSYAYLDPRVRLQ